MSAEWMKHKEAALEVVGMFSRNCFPMQTYFPGIWTRDWSPVPPFPVVRHSPPQAASDNL